MHGVNLEQSHEGQIEAAERAKSKPDLSLTDKLIEGITLLSLTWFIGSTGDMQSRARFNEFLGSTLPNPELLKTQASRM